MGMTKKELWLKLFSENDTALASAIHLCERYISDEQLLNSGDFLQQKKKELYDEMSPEQIQQIFGNKE